MRFLLLLMAFGVAPVAAQVAVRDDYGNEVRLAQPAQRIVSLSPHLTELLFAAGAGSRVVGAVDFSDYPAEARRLPSVGSDAGIDLEAVLALKPDLAVAWPNVGSVRAVNRIAELGVPTFRSEPRELEDIARTLERLGRLAGTDAQALQAAAAFRARVLEIEKRFSSKRRVRVFYQVWDRPLQTVNGAHVISKVMQMCGGENVFAVLPLLAPEIDREAVLRANPEVNVASREQAFEPWNRYPGLAAVARRHLYVIPPDLIQRHTPRLLDGALRMCEILDRARARS
jgi:iron complex transport system substrate-binding protein